MQVVCGDAVGRVDIDSVFNYARTYTTDSFRSLEIPERFLEIVSSGSNRQCSVVPGSNGASEY
eukprot:924835-Amorphochlora_amoeboformis.AAC.1